MNRTLEQVLADLEQHGWEFKLSAQRGQGYAARVWKPDVLDGGSKMHAPTPAEALSLALNDAIRRRRNRYRNLKRQRRTAKMEAQ